MERLTPMMQQYKDIKERYSDAILFFRLGDFYEMFFEDAEKASPILEITLTSREGGKDNRIPMCGVPYHSAENYISKLIAAGLKVAICEQVSDPSSSPGLVEREVVRVITPGTVTDEAMLNAGVNNYILSIVFYNNRFGVAHADVSTGCLRVTEFACGEEKSLLDELWRLKPVEFIIPESVAEMNVWNTIREYFPCVTTNKVRPRRLWMEYGYHALLRQFGTSSLDGFGCSHLEAGIIAAGELLVYLRETQNSQLNHFVKLTPYETKRYMVLDSAARRNLELNEASPRWEKKTLLSLLDFTVTSMGSRYLRGMLDQPLMDEDVIQHRLGAVEVLKAALIKRRRLTEVLRSVYDLERLASRISYGHVNGRDLNNLRVSLEQIPVIKAMLSEIEDPRISQIERQLEPLEEVTTLIQQAIRDDAPQNVAEGNVIKSGYNTEVDRLRDILTNGKQWILDMENRERMRTGIKSLKVRFNKVFGYFIEVTKANLTSVPQDYIRKQTLVNCERFITDELKEYENTIFGAEERIAKLEYELFVEVRDFVSDFIPQIQDNALLVAELDALCSLGEAAAKYGYTRPEISRDNTCIKIVKGRHPVVEKSLEQGKFVANDVLLDNTDNRMLIITGPNMSGKSTFLRQTALIVIMAQIGSFVPAEYAELPIIDRVFTRIGASDDISTGRSTFMVEMNEAANIVHNATPSSLVLLDEVGRGTATYDGLSLAWALVEYLVVHVGCRTLFATHYHELISLEESLPGVKNFNVAAQERGEQIIFLHQVLPGGSDKSYGIHVARLAGIPAPIITRAQELLENLERGTSFHQCGREEGVRGQETSTERDLFESQWVAEVIKEIREMDIENITPLEALNRLHTLQSKVKCQ